MDKQYRIRQLISANVKILVDKIKGNNDDKAVTVTAVTVRIATAVNFVTFRFCPLSTGFYRHLVL